jgi:phosphoribosylaminoimidazole-succinocarboxamide synthase
VSAPVLYTNIPELPPPYRGKVRDVYELPGNTLLIVSTDRLSAMDVVMKNGVPDKGRILTGISLFWFKYLSEQIPGLNTHLVSDPLSMSSLERILSPESMSQLLGRSMVVRKLNPFKVEAVGREYLDGSGLKDYNATGAVCGIQLPPGLVRASKLPHPIYTPATKADQGEKDENITAARAAEIIGDPVLALKVEELTLAMFKVGSTRLAENGLILADTKFEFAPENDGITLIDEALTPDSSRFWEKSQYEPGRAQASFDKQPVRDHLATLTGWDGHTPLSLPEEVISATRERYLQAHYFITGEELATA